MIVLANVHCASSAYEAADSKTEAPLSGRPSAVFTARTIPVCWEATAQFAAERALVQSVVTSTWGAVPGARIRFVGWDGCEPGSQSVRITVARQRAYVRAFGQHILGMVGGVTLNFTYGEEYARGCAAPENVRSSCIVVDAVHEFGHVLGFSHEQNRSDLPSTSGCTEEQLRWGADDATTVAESTLDTMYDPSSVMNYCNPVYRNRHMPAYALFDAAHPWMLSAADRAGMAVMYPVRSGPM